MLTVGEWIDKVHEIRGGRCLMDLKDFGKE